MISVRNFEKYFKDHPEIPGKKEILEAARKAAEKNIVTGGMAEKILGPLTKAFFLELLSDPVHIRIGLEDMKKAGCKNVIVMPRP